MSWQSRLEQRNHSWGFDLSNRGSKYQSRISFEQRELKLQELGGDASYQATRRNASAEFVIRDASSTWDLFAAGYYFHNRQGSLLMPATQLNVGPIGIRKYFGSKREFSLDVLPTWDYRSFSDSTKSNFDTIENTNARLWMSARYDYDLKQNSQYTLITTWAPYFDLAGFSFDNQKSFISVKNQLSFSLSKHFELSYELEYQRDDQLKQNHNIMAENIINTVFFKLNL